MSRRSKKKKIVTNQRENKAKRQKDCNEQRLSIDYLHLASDENRLFAVQTAWLDSAELSILPPMVAAQKSQQSKTERVAIPSRM